MNGNCYCLILVMHLIILITISAILFHTNSLQLCFIMHKITLSRSFFLNFILRQFFNHVFNFFLCIMANSWCSFVLRLVLNDFFLEILCTTVFVFKDYSQKIILDLCYNRIQYMSPVRIYFCVLKKQTRVFHKTSTTMLYLFDNTVCVFDCKF